MNGVSRISSDENIMLVSFNDANPGQFPAILNAMAEAGVVVDMISQTPSLGKEVRFSFTASTTYFNAALKALGSMEGKVKSKPLISGGYSKLNLFGEEMVHQPGVAARAITCLFDSGIEICMVSTSELDISILVRSEDVDLALQALEKCYFEETAKN